jgi:elongation factor 1-gamma
MTPFGTLYTTVKFLHARVTKILAAANLNGLDISIDPDFKYGVTNRTAEYISKFPHGKIPAFETASGFYLAEGSAIAYYVADSGPRRDQLLGRTPEERALVQMWISFADSQIWPDGTAILSPMMGSSKYDKEVVGFHESQFVRALQRLEQHLDQGDKVWLVRDDELSLADLSVASGLLW